VSLRAIAPYPSALRVLRFTEVSRVVHHSDTKPEDINLVDKISASVKFVSYVVPVVGGRWWGVEGGTYIILAVTMAAGSTGRVVAMLLLQ